MNARRMTSSSPAPEGETRHAWQPSPSAGAPASSPPSEGDTSQVQSETRAKRSQEEEAVIDEIETILLKLKLKPGRDCVLHDGLVTVDVGVYHQPSDSNLGILLRADTASDGHARRVFAEIKSKTQVLKSIGWASSVISTGSWLRMRDTSERTHYLVDRLNEALTEKHHQHHEGCGCSH